MNRASCLLGSAIFFPFVIAGCGDGDHNAGKPSAADSGTDSGLDSGPSVNPEAGADSGVDASPGQDAGLDGGSIASGCPAVPLDAAAGTEHSGTIATDETWTAAGSPHVITSNLFIQSGTVTIEPCAVVRIQEGYVVNLGGNPGAADAKIVAHGESIDNPGAAPTRRPVIFERDDANAAWGSIEADATGTIDFEVVDLKGGGNPAFAPELGSTLIAAGAGGNTGLTKNLRTVDVTIDGSGGVGVAVKDRAAFTDDSAGLVIRNAGSAPPPGIVDTSFPIYVTGASISTVPPGSYTGNGTDEIAVTLATSLQDDAITIHKRGVPYRLDGFSMAPLLSAADGGLSTLTIEPGVTLRFSSTPTITGVMTLGVSNGGAPENIWPVRLIAAGTATDPIVLTSATATPAPGDWVGLAWAGGSATGNVMSHVTIDNAGAASGTVGFGCGTGNNDGALIIWNWRPDEAFITDSTFSNSAAGGIINGWDSDLDGPDFTNNTFTNIANGCNVSRWKDANNSCPADQPICF